MSRIQPNLLTTFQKTKIELLLLHLFKLVAVSVQSHASLNFSSHLPSSNNNNSNNKR